MERERESNLGERKSREKKVSLFCRVSDIEKGGKGNPEEGEVGRNFRYFSPSEGGGRCAEETHSPTIMKVGTKTHVFVGEIDKFLSILKFPFASFQGPPF